MLLGTKMSDIAIRVENLSKRYRIGLKEEMPDTLIAAMTNWFKSPLANFRQLRKLSHFSDNGYDPEDIIWALKDVSFEVKQGEVIGIIGRNGAGKSTLLKVLSRITEPTSGRAIINGRVSSLLEVGTGFHPELTGRENVYLNGTVLGMSKQEVGRKFDEIIDFSGVEKFIDTPVKRYSSGMKVRLAFAVAAHLEPEILMVDEVLAVGDAEFQKKCLGKMEGIAQTGRTVLFVSHHMDMIRALCSRCVLLNDGRIHLDGEPAEVIQNYLKALNQQAKHPYFEVEEDKHLPLQITRGRILNVDGKLQNSFDIFEQITIDYDYVVRKRTYGAIIYFELNRNGSLLFRSFDSDKDMGKLEERQPGIYNCSITLPSPLLKPGQYSITSGISIPYGMSVQRLEESLFFEVELNSDSSAFLSYSANRSGLIAVPLDWQTCIVDR
jgi:lipopolysaccharide transport system ATP-binding protein